MIDAEKITILNNDWITFIFLVILIILTIENFLFENRLLNTSSFFLKKKKMLFYFNKEKNIFLNLFQILFFIVQLLTISLILYFLNPFLGLKIGFTGFKLYIVVCIGVSLYFTFRLLTGIFLAFIFNIKPIHQKFSFEKISYFNNLILWILPLLILSSYAKQFDDLIFKITIFVFLFLLIIRYSLLLINNKKLIFNNLFYFILYLCALEIVPLVIILKLTI